MNDHTMYILNAVIATISDIFQGDFTRICEVKRSVFHLETIYFCRCTCRLILMEKRSLEEQLALYRETELIPQSTIAFFDKNRDVILKHWPDDGLFLERPEVLYEGLLTSELCIRQDEICYQQDKVSRDIAGAYYTSSDFSVQITRRALNTYLEQKEKERKRTDTPGDAFCRQDTFEEVQFLDYACGCGEFLLAVVQYFEDSFVDYPLKKLAVRLRGIDVNPIALMISVSRIVSRVGGKEDISLLRKVAANFVAGNPLLHNETTASLEVRFDNFALNRLYVNTEGVNCRELEQLSLIVLGNPPWEKLRFEERAFFRPLCPEISAISQKNKRAERIRELAQDWPELLDYYQQMQDDYAAVKKSIPRHPFLRMALVGELNTYALFAELASRLAGEHGFAAIIVKSALVTSTCHASCFRYFITKGSLSEVFLYDNRERIFQIDSREKFCVLFFGGMRDKGLNVHYGLTKKDELFTSAPLCIANEELTLINPETGLLPNVSNATEFSFLRRAHRSLSTFAKEFPCCHFGRLVHLTAHSEYISTTPSETNVPILEGKFFEQYDNRFATFAGVAKNERYRAKASARRQKEDGFLEQKPAPECRYFIDKKFWESFLRRYDQPYSLCWRSLTSPTNQRTMIATIIPSMPTCQSIQLLQTTSGEELLLILALFNSKAFDYFVRLKMAGIDLTQSVIRQIPVPLRESWKQTVKLGGVDYVASEAVKALEKLIYRNEPALSGLWNGVPDISEAEGRYLSSANVKDEIDRIIFRLYGFTNSEEKMVRYSFEA